MTADASHIDCTSVTGVTEVSSIMCTDDVHLLNVLYSAEYTVHCTPCIVHRTLYTVYVNLYTVQCTVFTVHCTRNTVHCTLYTVQSR